MGVLQDLAKALSWYEKSAEKGLAQAQFKLGDFYESGTVVLQDLAKALSWYAMAAQQGHQNAQLRLDILSLE